MAPPLIKPNLILTFSYEFPYVVVQGRALSADDSIEPVKYASLYTYFVGTRLGGCPALQSIAFSYSKSPLIKKTSANPAKVGEMCRT
jgi:hypothetical protein